MDVFSNTKTHKRRQVACSFKLLFFLKFSVELSHISSNECFVSLKRTYTLFKTVVLIPLINNSIGFWHLTIYLMMLSKREKLTMTSRTT